VSRINGLRGALENSAQWRDHYSDAVFSQKARLTTCDRRRRHSTRPRCLIAGLPAALSCDWRRSDHVSCCPVTARLQAARPKVEVTR
jgi:hypothetical protein